MADQPALIVTTGPQRHQRYTLHGEQTRLGRGNDADIRLTAASVSRQHLQITRRGAETLVQDLGSSNGTLLNGVPLTRPATVRSGDTLRLGDVQLEYVDSRAPAPRGPSPAHVHDFGEVRGSVNTGRPSNDRGNQIVGSGSIYGGDVHLGDNLDVDANPESLQELFSGRGPGRALMAVGLVLALAGFGIFMWTILTADAGGPHPLMVAGFALALVGAVLAKLGDGMSKAARQRDRTRRHW